MAEAIAPYEFILTNELGILKTADQWFDEGTQKRRMRDGSERKYRWLLPFLSFELAKLDQLNPFLERGPSYSAEVSKVLRALIRERRKTKQPYDDLLRALYGSCVLNDFSESLAFEGTVVHAMTKYVDICELQSIRIEYSSMGYERIQALSKTDAKWLVEVFGEPAEHQSFSIAYPHLRRNAVSRYCWDELRRVNETVRSLGHAQKTMHEWLRELVVRNLTGYKELLVRSVAREAKRVETGGDIEAARTATRVP
ncbi:MAG: hypothetical protein ACREJN_07865, partial [Nitrospiraceae bacterium]